MAAEGEAKAAGAVQRQEVRSVPHLRPGLGGSVLHPEDALVVVV